MDISLPSGVEADEEDLYIVNIEEEFIFTCLWGFCWFALQNWQHLLSFISFRIMVQVYIIVSTLFQNTPLTLTGIFCLSLNSMGLGFFYLSYVLPSFLWIKIEFKTCKF